MRKKKLSQLLLLRWLNLYGSYHPVHEALEFEMRRMKSHKDELRCCMATSIGSNRIGYADRVALIVNPKAVGGSLRKTSTQGRSDIKDH